jgi:DNA-binding NarL/FixJ family response regulator
MIRVMVRYGDVLALTYTGQLDLADKRAAGYADFFLSRPVPRMGDRQNHGRSRRDAPRALSRCHLVTRAGTGGTGRRGATAMAAARKAEALHPRRKIRRSHGRGSACGTYRQSPRRVVALQARHASAVAAADPSALVAVSLDREEAGLLLSAADSAAQAAPLHHGAGDHRKSIEAAPLARRLANRCGGARMPAVKIAARPLPVTDREREIAELIAAGLTNKEIAEQLTLSIRTVEGHVYRACYKLGVADRDELAELIRVEPLK